jgi:3',5'-cyclic AMP phosphodiesterase CpdA
MYARAAARKLCLVRLAWSTDCHLNFLNPAGLARFYDAARALRPDALLLTGDIAEADSLSEALQGVHNALRVPVYFVLGNHDFYGGSVAAVHDAMRALTARDQGLYWLPASGPIALPDGRVLLGQDGWGDGRAGTPEASGVRLNDWRQIEEFRRAGAMFNLPARLALLRELADASAAALRADLASALARAGDVLVMTHVPPFDGACWHEGAVSGPDWLPWFTCRATGDALLEQAAAHPARTITVLCGHTHSSGTFAPRANLVVRTGAAEYGAPVVVAL